MAKSKERIEARKLRRAGESIKVIAKKLGISRSSASTWCMDIRLTEEQRLKLVERDRLGGSRGRLIAAQNKINERVERSKRYAQLGMDKVGELSDRDLLIAGIALYWAEGSKKRRGSVRFINSDPVTLMLWIKWLKTFFGLANEDISCCVGINESHRERIDEVQEYWSKTLGIPIARFSKPSFKKTISKKFYENFYEHFGSLNVTALKSTNLYYEIMGMIEGVKKNILLLHDKIP